MTTYHIIIIAGLFATFLVIVVALIRSGELYRIIELLTTPKPKEEAAPKIDTGTSLVGLSENYDKTDTAIFEASEQLLKIESATAELRKQLQKIQAEKENVPEPPKSYKYAVFLDAGHGGLDADENYTTAPEYGRKYRHNNGAFHGGGWFYEGVSNRKIAALLEEKLHKAGIRCFMLNDAIEDTELDERVGKANGVHDAGIKGFGISIHSNAFNGKARGFECFSFSKTGASAKIAAQCVELFDQMAADLNTPNRGAKTARYSILRQTKMPFILPEFLFFDNEYDVLLLHQESTQELFAELLFQLVIWTQENVIF